MDITADPDFIQGSIQACCKKLNFVPVQADPWKEFEDLLIGLIKKGGSDKEFEDQWTMQLSYGLCLSCPWDWVESFIGGHNPPRHIWWEKLGHFRSETYKRLWCHPDESMKPSDGIVIYRYGEIQTTYKNDAWVDLGKNHERW